MIYRIATGYWDTEKAVFVSPDTIDTTTTIIPLYIKNQLADEKELIKTLYSQNLPLGEFINSPCIYELQIQTIQNQLDQLDFKSVRPLRSILVALENNIKFDKEDISTLTELETKIKSLRNKLKELKTVFE